MAEANERTGVAIILLKWSDHDVIVKAFSIFYMLKDSFNIIFIEDIQYF